MAHEVIYVSANCNQTPSIADWGENGLICYGSCNSVLVLDPDYGAGGKVIQTLVGHTQRVNAVKWIRNNGDESEVISGSTDGTAIVWSLKGGKSILKGHESNVNLVDGLSDKNKCTAVTASMDGSVKIWCRDQDNFLLKQTINYGYSFIVGLKLCKLPNFEDIFLALAHDNSNIDIYLQKTDNFELGVVLKGHEDWVRGLDFTVDDKGDILLASCSQDQYIRIWRLNLNNIVNFTLDSILTGHEGWIYSVNWGRNLQLLSASLDKTLVIWGLENNLWVENARLGEVGGNTLGFYGALFNLQKGKMKILAHSYHGAFHIWEEIGGKWEPCVTVGGHFAGVMDLSWEPRGEFLFSVSLDQTTRIHAPWKSSWHEIARPQVHGYDLAAIAVISRYKFASAAEEKVIRTFEAPANFVDNLQRICNIGDDFNEEAPRGASVPSLGLSNKAVYLGDDKGNNESFFTEIVSNKPPTEETLLQNTLWPEVQKLYGHGYEVYTLTASPNGMFLASACKATTIEHAAILIWDTKTWKLIQKLTSHNLTIVQLSFSPDNKNLLSVSRDRRWSMFSFSSSNQFELVATCDRKTSIHTRIIWCCDWTFDSVYFGTGSRDGKLVVWTKTNQDTKILGGYKSVSVLDLKESVTALNFAPVLVKGDYLIAVGLDGGQIILYKWRDEFVKVLFLDQKLAHHSTVKRLAFRPNFSLLQLASCGLDNSVKIHQIDSEQF